jgi:hypothetical protein
MSRQPRNGSGTRLFFGIVRLFFPFAAVGAYLFGNLLFRDITHVLPRLLQGAQEFLLPPTALAPPGHVFVDLGQGKALL